MDQPNKNLVPDSPLAGLENWLRTLIREEIRAATGQNGTKEAGRLISAKDAAKRWDVPKTWIESKARSGELPYVLLGNYKRFNPDDLEQFIKEHRK